MTKDKDTKTVVPALRFPEFRDGEGWVETTLKSISPSIFDGTHQTPKYTEVGVPFYSVENIVSGNKNKFISEDDHKIATLKNCPAKGDILITRIGTIGFSKVVDWNFDFSIYVTLAVVKKSDHFISNFLHQYFQSSIYQSEILSKSLLDAVPCKINMDELRNTRIFLPPDKEKKEQAKIAGFLGSLDDLISAVADKIETLKEYKKGLMQQLFPAEGKTIPAIRFPEFQNAGEWQTVSLGDVATFINGRAFKQDELLESGKYRVLRVGNFFSNAYWYHSDLELDENKYCDKGDLLYAWSASFGPRIWNEDKVIFHYHIWKVVEKEGISKDFLLILLDYETERIKNQQANGLGLLHITKGAIENWKTRVPKNILEQQKIAKNLSSVDELISIEIAKLDQLKAHKKGLMQQLFPKLQ